VTSNRSPTVDELNNVKQETVQWTAKSHRVTEVDSDGNEITPSNPKPVDTIVYNTNNIDEASTTVCYIGMEDKNGSWSVKRIDTTSGASFTYATVKNNTSYLTYDTAWTARAALTYENYGDSF
jgi:hypothetical protein